jgi:peptidoglycan/xylan/chitin deacetylase (PgdA/CDA1 family)
MNRYLSFGIVFFIYSVVGYVGINNTVPSSSSNLIATISAGGMILSLDALFKDIFYLNNYHHYLYEKDHLLFLEDFYNIPLANAQEKEQKKEGDDNSNNNNNENNEKENNKNDKYVILIFDRGYKTTFTKAKPILDKYNFKATIFVACDRTESSKGLSWDQLRQLQNEGHDIQSHGADHVKLIDLNTYEEMESIVREGKICLQEQGFNSTVFQAPYNKGGNDPKIAQIISKYFDFAFAEHAKYMFLNCDGWENFGYGRANYEGITDCSPYSSDGTPKPTNRYAMKEWSHDREKDKIYESKYVNEDPHGKKVNEAVLKNFIRILDKQIEFNKNGEINAIPIVSYHRLDTNKDFDTSPELFEQEMEYLYENDYNVINLADLGYDEDEERFYIKNVNDNKNELHSSRINQSNLKAK